MAKGYFSIDRDIEIEKAGGFFCHACVVGKTASEQSSDPRYCQSCYKVLKVEAEMQRTKRAAWIPKNMSHKTTPDATKVAPEGQEVVAKLVQHGKPPISKKRVVMQHPGGRPRKQGEVHRATRWRRAKQGILL